MLEDAGFTVDELIFIPADSKLHTLDYIYHEDLLVLPQQYQIECNKSYQQQI